MLSRQKLLDQGLNQVSPEDEVIEGQILTCNNGGISSFITLRTRATKENLPPFIALRNFKQGSPFLPSFLERLE
jgi:hypothetical protein